MMFRIVALVVVIVASLCSTMQTSDCGRTRQFTTALGPANGISCVNLGASLVPVSFNLCVQFGQNLGTLEVSPALLALPPEAIPTIAGILSDVGGKVRLVVRRHAGSTPAVQSIQAFGTSRELAGDEQFATLGARFNQNVIHDNLSGGV